MRLLSPTILAVSLLAAGCGPADRHEEITESRQLPAPRPEQTVGADTKSRFFGDSGPNPHGGGAAHEAGSPFSWDLPTGWKQADPRPMTVANFVVPGRDGIDASIASFPGTTGGALGNVNRWRGQMALPAISEAEAGKLQHM